MSAVLNNYMIEGFITESTLYLSFPCISTSKYVGPAYSKISLLIFCRANNGFLVKCVINENIKCTDHGWAAYMF